MISPWQERIQLAIKTLQQGLPIILMDKDREEEGDLMFAAEKITPQGINFMTHHARGLICLAMEHSIVERLELPLMPTRNSPQHQAAFTVSIDASRGITSGTSAFDRCHTIRVAVDPQCTPHDLSFPGHIFPLRAVKDGVLARAGHTEGSVDLARMAGLTASAVICEIMNADGSMAKLPELEEFAALQKVPMIYIDDIIRQRTLD